MTLLPHRLDELKPISGEERNIHVVRLQTLVAAGTGAHGTRGGRMIAGIRLRGKKHEVQGFGESPVERIEAANAFHPDFPLQLTRETEPASLDPTEMAGQSELPGQFEPCLAEVEIGGRSAQVERKAVLRDGRQIHRETGPSRHGGRSLSPALPCGNPESGPHRIGPCADS